MRIYSLDHSEDAVGIGVTLLRTLKPHTTPVITAALDDTGTLLATGSADGVIKVWDIRGGYVSHTLRGHTGLISALKFYVAPLTHSTSVPTSSRIGKQNRERQNDRERPLYNGSNEDTHSSPLFRLASGGEDGKSRIWDLVKGKAIATLDSHVSVVRRLDFTPKHNVILSVSRDKTAILWNADSGKLRRVIPVLEGLEAAGFLRNGTIFYTGGQNGEIRIWDVESGRELTTHRPEQTKDSEQGNGNNILHVLHQDGLDFLLSVHGDQSLKLHSLGSLSSMNSGQSLHSLPILKRISGTHAEIIDMAFVSQNLLALATNSEAIRLISVSAHSDTKEILEDPNQTSSSSSYFGADVGLLQGHQDIVICLDVDWSGHWVATGAKDNTAKLWRIDPSAQSFECFATYSGHTDSLGAISLPRVIPPIDSAAYLDPLSHPPSFILTGSQDQTIKRWDTKTKTLITGAIRSVYTRKAHDKDINAIAIDEQAKCFASASQDRTVRIWSVDDGDGLGVLRGHKRGVWTVQFAPKSIPQISGEAGVESTSRGVILTGSGDKSVKIWSLFDYSCLRTLEGHTSSVLKVVWLRTEPQDSSGPNRRKARATLASAGGDGLVKVWDASTGDCLCTLDNHTDRIWALTSDPKQGYLVSAGGDSVITFWADTTVATAANTAAVAAARVSQEQDLLNHSHSGNYREAIVLALQLNHPARLLALLTDVVKTHPPEIGSLSGVKAVDEVLKNLADEQLFTLLLRLRDWNTNARTAPVASRILWTIFKSYAPSRLARLRRKGKGLEDILESLRVYTERHYKQCEELIEESYVLDFLLRGMENSGYVAASEGFGA